MGFFKNLFGGSDNRGELDKNGESSDDNYNGVQINHDSLHEDISDVFGETVTSEMLTDFANNLSLEEIDNLTGDDWNAFMKKNFEDLEVYMEGVAEGGGVESSWNNMLKTYRTVG